MYRPTLFMYTFTFRPTQKSFRLTKTYYFQENFHEIEEILTITHYCYEKVYEIQRIITIYITCNQ